MIEDDDPIFGPNPKSPQEPVSQEHSNVPEDISVNTLEDDKRVEEEETTIEHDMNNAGIWFFQLMKLESEWKRTGWPERTMEQLNEVVETARFLEYWVERAREKVDSMGYLATPEQTVTLITYEQTVKSSLPDW